MTVSIYAVESVGVGYSIRVHRRSHDYGRAADAFRSLRKYQCRELRMVKVTNGVRILLKYINRARSDF